MKARGTACLCCCFVPSIDDGALSVICRTCQAQHQAPPLLTSPPPARARAPQVAGDLWQTAAFIDACRLPYIAPSLGGVESLIEQPTVISYWDQGPDKRAAIGIKDNLVRFSCGVENVEDIWADISQVRAAPCFALPGIGSAWLGLVFCCVVSGVA